MRLENWSFMIIRKNEFGLPPSSEYALPNENLEKVVPHSRFISQSYPIRVHGNVYGHSNPDFSDGESIITSPIEKFDEDELTVVTRSGSVYSLGKKSKAYEEYEKEMRE